MRHWASLSAVTFSLLFCFLSLSLPVITSAGAAKKEPSALVEKQPLVLKYHNGLLLKGDFTFNILWYGNFTPSQRAILIDFVRSLGPGKGSTPVSPSVASWWKTTERYKAGPTNIHLGKQISDEACSLGKSLKGGDIARLAGKLAGRNVITALFTAKDVAVEGFCRSRCGTHGSARAATNRGARFAYVWVGNPESQCPGQCAWPFHQPIYGPQTPPLVAPNGDVGVDGMVINLATVLAGTVTNPFNNGYFQGPPEAPLEAVSACPGIFGTGAYPGYPGKTLKDGPTGSSFNARGVDGRKYLLPAMWDPSTSTCATLL